MSFKVTHQNGRLNLQEQGLAEEKATYLREYLAKVNHYKVIGFFQGSPVYSLYQPPLTTEAGYRALVHRLKRRFDHEKFPATATISVTKACQCDCGHCSAAYYNRSAKKVLSKKEFVEVLHQTIALGVTTIIFLGGEPLLCPDLPALISSVSPLQASTIIFTNGEYLTPQMCRNLQQAGLLGAFVSLDSVAEAEHDYLRQRSGLFRRALAGIENMRKTGLMVGLSSYLSPERLREGIFEKTMEFGKKLGVHEVTFFDAIPSGRWLKDASCCLTPQDRVVIRDLVNTYRKKKAYPGLSVQSTMTGTCGSAFCFAANTQFYLTATGEMCPCDFTPLTIGRFPDQSIKKLWKKMVCTPPYNSRAKSCRMQDPLFRKQYIEPLSVAGPFPYPLQSFFTV